MKKPAWAKVLDLRGESLLEKRQENPPNGGRAFFKKRRRKLIRENRIKTGLSQKMAARGGLRSREKGESQ